MGWVILMLACYNKSMKRYARGTHPYYQYKRERSLSLAAPKQRRPWLLIIALPFVGLIALGSFLYGRPLQPLQAEKQVLALSPTTQPKINWPSESQAAFGTVETGLLESKPGQTVQPTASTIKLLTALTILEAKPLKAGEQGPFIPITKADVDIYNKYYEKNGSTALVAEGEQISQYQMLEGILLPSSNNYADSLASWAFGGLQNYQPAAQAMAKKIGMNKTTVGEDASGFSASTVSTADDLVLLGIAAMKHPVVADIVKLTEVKLPVAGVKQNTNWLLGDEGVVGIKTGNTNEIGGVFIFAYNHVIDKTHKVTVVGAIQGESTVFSAVLKARSFIQDIKPHFKIITPVKQGQVMAHYAAPWGKRVAVVAQKDLSLMMWPGKKLEPKVTVNPISSNTPKGSNVGTVAVGNDSSNLTTADQFVAPSWQWRIFAR